MPIPDPERGTNRYQVSADYLLAPRENDLVREVVESIIIRHDTSRWFKNEKAG